MEKVRWKIVRLNEQQATKSTLDAHISLIVIEVVSESVPTLPFVAKRIRSHIGSSNSVLLLEGICALPLPATPFSGAQVVAHRLAPLLVGIVHEMHVYHGMTALLFLQRLREAGAVTVIPDQSVESVTSCTPANVAQHGHSIPQEPRETSLVPLPYLAFLTRYPSLPLLHLFPYELACHYQCVPIGAERNMLTLATCHWLNHEAVVQLHVVTRRKIFQVRCEVTMIDELLCYWQHLQEGPEQSAGVKNARDRVV